jgi:hypothetical protein
MGLFSDLIPRTVGPGRFSDLVPLQRAPGLVDLLMDAVAPPVTLAPPAVTRTPAPPALLTPGRPAEPSLPVEPTVEGVTLADLLMRAVTPPPVTPQPRPSVTPIPRPVSPAPGASTGIFDDIPIVGGKSGGGMFDDIPFSAPSGSAHRCAAGAAGATCRAHLARRRADGGARPCHDARPPGRGGLPRPARYQRPDARPDPPLNGARGRAAHHGSSARPDRRSHGPILARRRPRGGAAAVPPAHPRGARWPCAQRGAGLAGDPRSREPRQRAPDARRDAGGDADDPARPARGLAVRDEARRGRDRGGRGQAGAAGVRPGDGARGGERAGRLRDLGRDAAGDREPLDGDQPDPHEPGGAGRRRGGELR